MRQRLATRLSRPGIRLRRLPVPAMISLGVLIVVALAAILAPLIADNPLTSGVPAQPPSGDHWFGTDRNGRDVFARVVYGARTSLLIGLGATALAVVTGAVLGGIAATSRKAVNESVMRVLDVVMAFPPIALAAVLVIRFGSGLPVLTLAIAAVYVPSLTRVVRANVLAQYGEDYVAAEQVIGARRAHILTKHVAINCAAPVMVFATVLVADAIIFEASLSFLGAGIPLPDPSWGNVLSVGRNLLLSGGWWATFFPGLAILVTVLALNVLAEGLTDAWAAPRATARVRTRPAGENAAGLSTATIADEVALDPADAPLGPDQASAHADFAESGRLSNGTDVDATLRRLAEVVALEGPRVPPLAGTPPKLLSVQDLRIHFPDRHGPTAVVDGVSFDVGVGETLGLVGESGCGKSLTSLAVMGLLPRGAQVTGRIVYDGEDQLSVSPRRRRQLAGTEIAIVYQDAMSSLNPSVPIGAQLRQLTRRGGTRTPRELLELVDLSPDRTMRSRPHEISGGQRQRVLIAMALSRSPRLLIADEPTTALDVTVQAQVVELLAQLRQELGFAMVLVSHDLGLIGEMVHRVAVMYAGQVAEVGTPASLFTGPRHHYARGLLGSVLSLEAGSDRLHQIPGVVPAPRDFAAGCRFSDRCAAATEQCRTTRPPVTAAAPGHAFACWHPAPAPEGALT